MKNAKKVVSFDKNFDFYMDMGTESSNDGNYLKALKYFFSASKKKPSDTGALLNLALVYQKMGLYEASNSVLFKVLSTDSANEGACALLGQNFAFLGDSLRELYYLKNFSELTDDVDLMEIFENSLNLMPQYEQIYPMPAHLCEALKQRAAKLFAEGRIEEAKENFYEILESYPDDAFAKNNICQILIVEGKFAQVIDIAKEVVRKDGKNIFGWCNLAMALYFVGNIQQCDDAVQRILQIAPQDADDEKRVIKIMCLTGRHSQAYSRCRKYLAGNPYDADYLTFAAVAAYNAGLYQQAKDNFLVMNRIFPESELLRYYLDLTEAAIDGQPVEAAIPYDLKLPVERENIVKKSIAEMDFSTVWENDDAERLISWAFNNEELALTEVIADKLILSDAKKARKVLQNLLAQDYGWQMKRIVLRKLLQNYPKKDIYINKDGYFLQLEMPKKKIPQEVEQPFWNAFSTLSVFFVDDDNWVEKLAFSAQSILCKLDLLREAAATDDEVAALLVRLTRLNGFDDKQICVLFRVAYNRLAKLTEILFD